MTATNKFVVSITGEILGRFISQSGAWKTYQSTDGWQRKLRGGRIVEMPAEDAKPATTQSEPKSTTQKAESKTKPKRDGATTRRIGNSEIRNFDKYSRNKTESGVSFDCGDSTAKKLRSMTLDEIYKTAGRAMHEADCEQFKSAAAAENFLRSRYGKLNHGMQRMNLGNRLRALA